MKNTLNIYRGKLGKIFIMGLPVKLSVTNSNYCTPGKDIESWETLRASVGLPWNATASLDYGVREYTERNSDSIITKSVSPAFEAKYKQNIGEHINGYVRYRNYDQTSQFRASVGASCKLDDNVGLYGGIHGTAKWKECSQPAYTAGGWVGLDININKHWSAWIEPFQVNYKFAEKQFGRAGNCGILYKF